MRFSRYPKYMDSGVEWLGEVPEGWGVTKLKHSCRFVSGGTPNKANIDYWEGAVPWASSKDLKTDVLADTVDHISELAVQDGATLLEPGDLLVVVRGMILAHSFPVAKIVAKMAINQDLKALRVGNGWHEDFFANVLRAAKPETFRRLDEAGHGTKALRMEAWTGMAIPKPPIQEQRAIASFLDRETARIDALMAEQERLIELLREKRQAVISHAVTKGLDPTVPMKDSGVEWLGEVPAHWGVQKIKHQVASIEQGWSPQCENYPAEADSEWGVLKVGCVNGGRFDPSENKLLPQDLEPIPTLAIERGDLLISRANTRQLVGSAAVAKRSYPRLMLCDKLYRLRVDSRICTPDFICYYLGSSGVRGRIEIEATGASSSMLNIGQSAILELDIAVPPVDEQRTILAHFAEETARLEALVTEAQRAITLLQERRTALISAAVTGQIDVRNHQTPEHHHVGG